MGWETRGRGRYYYLKLRLGRRVISKYVHADTARMAVQLDAIDRRQKAATLKAEQKERDRIEAADAPLAELQRMIHGFTAATLLANGYHLHHRQWRRTRGG